MSWRSVPWIALGLWASLWVAGCCGSGSSDSSGDSEEDKGEEGDSTLRNLTPYYLHFLGPGQVFLYVPPGESVTLHLKSAWSDPATILVAPGQEIVDSVKSEALHCCLNHCTDVDVRAVSGRLQATSMPLDCTDAGGSCPYVYAHDGQRFRLVGEALVGALNQGAARTDALTLPGIRPHRGRYLIRVASVLPETNYLDQASLELLDLPPSRRVALDDAGRAWTYAEIRQPLSASDRRGRSQLAAVSRADRKAWTSREVGTENWVRDHLVVTLPVPSESLPVGLLLRGHNTERFQELYHQYLAQFGPGFPKVLRLLANGMGYGEAIASLLRSSGFGLALRVQTPEGWRLFATVDPIGPAGPRTVLVPLPPSIPDGPSITIRIDAMPGAWWIDQVGLARDLRRAPPGRVEPVLSGAWHEAARPMVGRQPRPSTAPPALAAATDRPLPAATVRSLRDADERYARIAHGAHLSLAFAAPPTPRGTRRTAILRLRGYYEELDLSPEPCLRWSPLLEALLLPDAYARFVLERLRYDLWLEGFVAWHGRGVAAPWEGPPTPLSRGVPPRGRHRTSRPGERSREDRSRVPPGHRAQSGHRLPSASGAPR